MLMRLLRHQIIQRIDQLLLGVIADRLQQGIVDVRVLSLICLALLRRGFIDRFPRHHRRLVVDAVLPAAYRAR